MVVEKHTLYNFSTSAIESSYRLIIQQFDYKLVGGSRVSGLL